MTHVLEDLTHKMVPVNLQKKKVCWIQLVYFSYSIFFVNFRHVVSSPFPMEHPPTEFSTPTSGLRAHRSVRPMVMELSLQKHTDPSGAWDSKTLKDPFHVNMIGEFRKKQTN